MKKKILTSVFISAIILSISNSFAYDTSGNCGNNCTWDYDATTHTLVVSGSGTITNPTWKYEATGIENYKTSVQKIIIEGASANSTGITSMAYQTFAYMTGVTDLIIGNSVTTIGEEAFSGMTGITSLIIPDSVTTIQRRAFQGMSGITNLTIPDNASIESLAFSLMYPSSITCSASQLEAYLTTGYGELSIDENGRRNIICTKGDCEKYIREESKYKNNSTFLAGLKVVPQRLERELADGSIEVYEMGVFKGYKNKRIYTVDEANRVTGKTNRFSIKYR